MIFNNAMKKLNIMVDNIAANSLKCILEKKLQDPPIQNISSSVTGSAAKSCVDN